MIARLFVLFCFLELKIHLRDFLAVHNLIMWVVSAVQKPPGTQNNNNNLSRCYPEHFYGWSHLILIKKTRVKLLVLFWLSFAEEAIKAKGFALTLRIMIVKIRSMSSVPSNCDHNCCPVFPLIPVICLLWISLCVTDVKTSLIASLLFHGMYNLKLTDSGLLKGEEFSARSRVDPTAS